MSVVGSDASWNVVTSQLGHLWVTKRQAGCLVGTTEVPQKVDGPQRRRRLRPRASETSLVYGRRKITRRRRALLPINPQLRTCPGASANFRLCANSRPEHVQQ